MTISMDSDNIVIVNQKMDKINKRRSNFLIFVILWALTDSALSAVLDKPK